MIVPAYEETFLFDLLDGKSLESLKKEISRVCSAGANGNYAYAIEELQGGLILIRFISLSKFDDDVMMKVENLIYKEFAENLHLHFTNNFDSAPGLFYTICVKAPVLYAGRCGELDDIDRNIRNLVEKKSLGKVRDYFSLGYLTYVFELDKPLPGDVRKAIKMAIWDGFPCPVVFERPIEVNQTWFTRLTDWLRWKLRGY